MHNYMDHTHVIKLQRKAWSDIHKIQDTVCLLGRRNGNEEFGYVILSCAVGAWMFH